MNEPNNDTTQEQAAGFQRIWMDTMSKTMQAAFTFTPNSPPPDVMRQIRKGIFAALAESWEQFMRSPEFLDTTRQTMEQAVAFRKMTNDMLGKVRHQMQAPASEDINTIMLAVRHMEKRLLDRIEQLSLQVNSGTARPAGKSRARKTARTAHASTTKSRRNSGQPKL
jgi:hypothetical protein